MTETDDKRIAQIYQAVFGVTGTESTGIVGQMNDILSLIKNLPETNPSCQHRVGRLEVIETWKGSIEKDNRFKNQAGLKLWHGILLVGASSTLQLVVMLLLLWAQR